jgi:small-conductance mechanosensitive channel
MNERRVVFSVQVIHQTPLEKLKTIPKFIREIVERNSLARFERSHMNSINEFSLNIETVFWVKSPDYNVYMDLQQAFNFEILARFKEEGIQLAYPTRSLFVKQEPDFGTERRYENEFKWSAPFASN